MCSPCRVPHSELPYVGGVSAPVPSVPSCQRTFGKSDCFSIGYSPLRFSRSSAAVLLSLLFAPLSPPQAAVSNVLLRARSNGRRYYQHTWRRSVAGVNTTKPPAQTVPPLLPRRKATGHAVISCHSEHREESSHPRPQTPKRLRFSIRSLRAFLLRIDNVHSRCHAFTLSQHLFFLQVGHPFRHLSNLLHDLHFRIAHSLTLFLAHSNRL